MLTGIAVRLAQSLQINVESTDGHNSRLICRSSPSPSMCESRRRLMWGIYAMDTWVGSGVDELTLVNEANVKIRLPCNERDFILEVLNRLPQPGLYSSSPSGHDTPDLDVAAYFLRLVSIRRKVLRYVVFTA